ncbi:histidine utilization repressor [Neopusillimonas maritima]|jgi:GntR family histidine utilization transcriptional repressor|uniref:Histidine utilization repressor n=1 Tax=Neopusillimonas maritima TaxID=2026239 RepID=A0ABX9MV97_9BURK|nr:histidine utilization repressor [Neopusillimonas maritima]MBF23109.1 histidine utilization repressor [Pusillimonas sp.]RII82747.1 histidine utilization repressor [Neopusillimonas maritima]|tara:strand:- start:1236 stop:1952 length:717 start_codon:yes stop_codon:yes gene_type:complete
MASNLKTTARYAQMKEEIRKFIVSGQWKPGQRVPSEHELTVQYNVSRMTANRVLRELTAEGFIERKQGVGSFVIELYPISSFLQIRDIKEEILERGHQHEAKVLTLRSFQCDASLAEALRLKPGADVFSTELIHFENHRPIQLEHRFVNPAVCPNFLSLDLSTATPSHYLFEHAPLTEAEQIVEAILASKVVAEALEIRRGAPCLLINRRTFSGKEVASVARLYHPGDRYRLMGKFKP